MSTEQHPTADRDQELRTLLVATATATPAPSPKRGRTLVGSIIAFGLAGALTGGAISAAAALNAPEPAESTGPVTISIDEMTSTIVRDDTRLFDTPFVVRSSGDTTIELGKAPAGASSIAFALHCLDAGSFDYSIDGDWIGRTSCSQQDTEFTNGGGFIDIQGNGVHTLRINARSQNGYVIWASWATPAPPPEPSAQQQAALSDGIVTQDEYRAAFARYSECMSSAGYPLVFVDESLTVIQYSNTADAVGSGVEEQCYHSEFKQVDTDWQLQQ